jgi:carbonic anhydrase
MNSTARNLSIAMLLALAAGCSHHQSGSTQAAHKAHWSYSGETGPAHWGSLAPEYALCATGLSQSPINIDAPSRRDLANISFNYQPSPVEIVNNGHTVQVNYAPGSFIELDGQRFDLAQFHFHSPSEHTIGGGTAAAEMHLVHKSANGSLAVVGVMIQEGAHNNAFAPVWSNLPASEGPARKVGATIDADDLLPADQRTYRYNGSLTTPPGTEGVKWCLMVEPVTMSASQIADFRKLYFGNNRPTQARNGREIIEDTSR